MGRKGRPSVVFAIPTMGAGGAERVFSTLLRHIDTDRFDVRLVVFDGRDAVFLSGLPSEIEVVDLRAKRVRLGVCAFIRTLHALRPDVVLSTLEHLNKILCATRPIWPRDIRLIVRLSAIVHLESWLARVEARVLYSLADAVIYQSAAMRRAYEERLGHSFPKAVVIDNPVDIAAIQSAAGQPAAAISFPDGVINLVTAGHFEPCKGFDLLVRAMAKASPRLHLTILGDGGDPDSFQNLVDSLGLTSRVHRKGVQPNPYPFFAQADAFVLPSRSEGSPNVVFEALACGAPIVATPVAGMDRLLGGMPGCHVADAVSEDALVRVLDSFCQSPRQRSAAVAIAHQNAPVIARRYEELILKTITGA